MQKEIDNLRRDLADAVWQVDKDGRRPCTPEDRIDAIEPFARQIFKLYNELHPAQPGPNPTGLILAGRTADGSYIFSSDGKVKHFDRTSGIVTKRVKRRVSRRKFKPDSYRYDSEFGSLFS